MNRFRTKRKVKDEGGGGGGGGGLGRSFLRGRKAHEEPKKELDLNTALPSQDNFRTSLLMSGLSARFSLLREQDDPNTKIGKASDDSVLFASRQSRFMDYGFPNGLGPLADIAEVESIKAAPSFNRMDSFMSDDADSVGGNVMNRGKPTEGNNLFGGRQKIYKITNGTSSANGGMSGKALYGDDVATSAFQRWRQAEKAQQAMGRSNLGDDGEGQRPDSPLSNGYDRKRETSSTSSSGNSLGWNSTAATSIMSQPATSFKDWQSANSAATPGSMAAAPGLDRSATRNRRLYEQGLSHDLHEQQTSALSRFDTLSRQRNTGSRTPDVSTNSPSPTTATGGFGDRFAFGSDRRQILGKASAPNLRSFSPPTTASSSMGAADLGIRLPTVSDRQNSFGASPPLSPPISEGGDRPVLPIQPSDRGKATAMGVFQKPNQGYDDSKYAQRQLQLQQGRETPTQRFRTESDASAMSGRSRSSSSANRQALLGNNGLDHLKLTQAAVPEESRESTSFLDDAETPPPPVARFPGPQPSLQRPSDSDHPAFRHDSAMPTPLSLNAASRASEEASPISELPDLLPSRGNSHPVSPEDSPTLGPGPAGLSGMVRQHLRNDSTASSVYGPVPPTAGLDAPPLPHLDDRSSVVESLGSKSNPWSLHHEQDWIPNARQAGNGSPTRTRSSQTSTEPPTRQASSKTPSRSSRDHDRDRDDGEGDEFANQLANARRRVRERLTSYVETDGTREESPQRFPDLPADMPSSRSNSMGMGILKPKSSRGSLVDRSRDTTQSKAMKMLGIGVSTVNNNTSPPPAPVQPPFEDRDMTTLPTMQEDVLGMDDNADDGHAHTNEEVSDVDAKSLKEDENIHPGLRAFRQARRQLQRRKELETLARHQAQAEPSQPGTPQQVEQAPSPAPPPSGRQRTRSRERRPPPPPVMYQGRAASQESKHSSSSVERGRSESDTSAERAGKRPARLRNGSTPRDDSSGHYPGTVNNGGGLPAPPRPGMLRSPGLPGTDIRHSPIIPPQGYPGSGPSSAAPSPRYLERPNPTGTLQPGRPFYSEGSSGQPSPVSPLPPVSPMMGLPSSPFPGANGGSAATTPTLLPSPRRPSAPPPNPNFSVTASTLSESMKKVVNKADISEPTFIMSTSRVPTVALPSSTNALNDASQQRQRSRSASRTRADANVGAPSPAPPVPPLHPMRRQDTSRTKAMLGNLMARRADGSDDMASISSPHLPLPSSSPNASREDLGDRKSSFSISDDEDHPERQRRRLRKQSIDAKTMGSSARAALGRLGDSRDRGSPFVATGPPVSRSIITPMKTGPSTSIPGGMF